MSTRTFRIYGRGFGTPGTVSLNVVAHGNVTVFNGVIPSYEEPPTPLPDVPINQLDLLYTFDIPVSFSGTTDMSVAVSGGAVTIGPETSNYCQIYNPVFTSGEVAVLTDPNSTQAERVAIYSAHANPPLTTADEAYLMDPSHTIAEKQTLLESHGVALYVSSGADTWSWTYGDPRSNVQLDGIAESRGAEPPGIWYWLVPDGSTLTYTETIAAGVEVTQI